MRHDRRWRILLLLVLVIITGGIAAYRLNWVATELLPGLDVPGALDVPAGSQPSGAAPPVDASLDDLLSAVNQQRAANGLPALTVDQRLMSVAQQVSEAAARQDTLSPGVSNVEMAYAAGYTFDELRQMIFSADRGSADQALAVWLGEADLREMLLTTEFTDVGLGRTPAVRGFYYYTLLLGRPQTLTAPGATMNNPGEASVMGQARVIVDLVNAARRQQNQRALVLNTGLMAAAQRHSDDQAARDVMSHQGSDGGYVADRASAAGYAWATVGENVLARYTRHAAAAFDQWWNSPDHRANMLNDDFTEIGIGYAQAASGAYYYTMVLARPQ